MVRGRGYTRGSYRGGSGRGSWGGGRGGYSPRGRGSDRGFHSSFSGSFDSTRSKYSSSGDKYSGSKGHDDYRKPYRMESSYSGRDSNSHRSPDHKRQKTEAPSSRHDSSYGGYGSGRYESSERRSFSNDRHSAPFSNTNSSRRDEFRRPSGPPPRGGYRGRMSSRGNRGLKLRERPTTTRRRLVDSSYAVRKRIIPTRSSDYVRKLKIAKMRSAIAKRKIVAEKEASDHEKEDKEDNKESTTQREADEDKEEKEEAPLKKDSKDEEETSGKEEPPAVDEPATSKKSFIKLVCPHCNVKVMTFRKYEMHLQSRTHLTAMRRVAFKQKSILAQMRQAQRNKQNELEKATEDLGNRTNFCPICKLNYKQRKSMHQTSDAHKNMKKFLMPFCKVCNITFKSPMLYESHCCSIEHLKRKQRAENSDSEEVQEEDNLDNFTTIDSVGVDEDEDKKESREPVNVGIEQIRKVDAHYCDLCKIYITHGSEDEVMNVIVKHCKQRTHMQRYIRYKEDKDLEKRAEKLQRKETAEKESKERLEKESISSVPVKKEKLDKNEDNSNKNTDDDEARDDKMWADVDKDLGDILAEAESGNKSSDEDEDINGERYDRFKYSEKNGEENKKEADSNSICTKDDAANEIKK